MKPGHLVRLTLSFGLLAAAVLLVVLWVKPKTDLSFVFPRNPSLDLELLAERLQRGPSATLLLLALSAQPAETASPEVLVRLSNRLAGTLDESGRFRFVVNGTIRGPGPEAAALFGKRYLLNPPVTAAAFSAAALRASFEQRLAELHTALGTVSKRLLPSDPTGRMQEILGSWQGTRGSAPPVGAWLSADQTSAFIMVRSAGPAYDLAAQQEAVDFIGQAFEEIKGEALAQMEMAGPIVFAVQSSRVIQSEMRWLTLLSALLVIALLLAVFRSLSMLSAFLLPLGFGLCAGIFAVLALFGEIHGITLAFGGILMGISVDYPIHLASHTVSNDGTRAALRSIWPTLRLGMLTTVAAFMAIALSSFPGLAQLGAFAISGLITAALATRWLLPLVLPGVAPPPPSALWSRLRPTPRQIRLLRLAFLALAVPAIAMIGFRGNGLWETDLRNLSPVPAEARAMDRRLRDQMGAADVRYLLVVREPSIEKVLQHSESLAEGLQDLVADERLGGFDMAARYLPSLKSQERRRDALPSRAELAEAVAEAAEGLPFRSGLFEPFLEAVSRSKLGPPLLLEDFREAGLEWLIGALLFQQGDDWVGLIAPQALRDPQALANFVAARNDSSLSFLDLQRGSEALVADYRQEALLLLAIGSLVAVVTLFLGLRSHTRVFRVTMPVALSVLFTVATLSLTGTAFSIFHLLALLLVAGVGLDYALFFERYAAHPLDWARTLRAVILSAITTVTVFSVLAFSSIPVLHGLGETVAVGALLSLVLTYLFTAQSNPAQS